MNSIEHENWEPLEHKYPDTQPLMQENTAARGLNSESERNLFFATTVLYCLCLVAVWILKPATAAFWRSLGQNNHTLTIFITCCIPVVMHIGRPFAWSKRELERKRRDDPRYLRHKVVAFAIIFAFLGVRLAAGLYLNHVMKISEGYAPSETLTTLFIIAQSNFYEEILFKGMTYRCLKDLLPIRIVAMLLTGVLFVMIHSPFSPMGWLGCFIVGMLHLAVFNLYPSLTVAVIFHFLCNAFILFV